MQAFLLPAAQADTLFVSSNGSDEVLRYDPQTGVFQDFFISAGSGGLDQPHGILERCNDLLVCSFGTDSVLRFDRTTGAFLDVFIDSSSGLNNPVYIVTGPDDLLYIASQASDEILRYTSAGVFVDAFVNAGSGGLSGPSGFAFGSDGRLYVAGRFSANVLAYNSTTGAFDAVIADATDGLGVGNTFGLNFGDNGDLYFASNGSVFRYDLGSSSIVATIGVSTIGLEPAPTSGVFAATANNLRLINTTDNSVASPFLTGGTISTLNFFHFSSVPPINQCSSTVPAASSWGIAALTLLILAVGTIIFRSDGRLRQQA